MSPPDKPSTSNGLDQDGQTSAAGNTGGGPGMTNLQKAASALVDLIQGRNPQPQLGAQGLQGNSRAFFGATNGRSTPLGYARINFPLGGRSSRIPGFPGMVQDVNIATMAQASFCDPRIDDSVNELDQEGFMVEGLSEPAFGSGSDINIRAIKRGFTNPGRPPTRSTSEQIRDIEREYEEDKLRKLKEEGDQKLLKQKMDEAVKAEELEGKVTVSKHEPLYTVLSERIGDLTLVMTTAESGQPEAGSIQDGSNLNDSAQLSAEDEAKGQAMFPEQVGNSSNAEKKKSHGSDNIDHKDDHAK